MSSQNKWSGSFGKSGDSASGGNKVQGTNVYKAPAPSPMTKSSSSVRDNVIKMKTGPGDNMGMNDQSSHNNINTFTRGIKSRGPYGGPSFSSFNTSKQNMQRSDTTGISKFNNPSGSSTSRGSAGGSGLGMTKNSKVGSGQAKMERQSSPRSNKDGSGHQSGLGRKRA
jgi:hypothetical protein